jgi:hypothetical protein
MLVRFVHFVVRFVLRIDPTRVMDSDIFVPVQSWGRQSRGNIDRGKGKDNKTHVRVHV